MTDDIQRELERLRSEITNMEGVLADLEAEVLDMQHELEDFRTRYDRTVQPVATRLEAVQAAIADLEAERDARLNLLRYGPDSPVDSSRGWKPPDDYVPIEEQFRRLWESPPADAAPEIDIPQNKPRAAAADSREAQVKRLYRQLARQYHPDLATDPDERDLRNDLMARINDAYTRRDLEALQAIAHQPDGARAGEPLAALQLQELRQIREQLGQRLSELRFEHTSLLHSDLMRLKVESTLSQGRGRDLLTDLAAQLEREYEAAMHTLESLRNELRGR